VSVDPATRQHDPVEHAEGLLQEEAEAVYAIACIPGLLFPLASSVKKMHWP